MKMETVGDFVPTDGQGSRRDLVGDRDCSVCHESWSIPPSSREIKRGVTTAVVVCLHKAVLRRMSDGDYPRIASICRSDKKLCGGNLWTAIKPPLVAEVKPFFQLRPIKADAVEKTKWNPDPKPKTRPNPRRVNSEQDEDRPNRKKGQERHRKPYEVT